MEQPSPADSMGLTETPRLAVIGAGFTGSLTATQVLRNATQPFDLLLLERRPPFGSGTAFATSLPCHLLNVPVIRMSAIAGEPDHLLRWLANGGSPEPSLASESAYLPRQVYGAYVEHTLRAAAESSCARLVRMVGEAVSIDAAEPGARIRLRDGTSLEARCVVLAIGNPPPSDPLGAGSPPSSRRYAGDPWDPAALDGLEPGDPVLTIGSNLTMVDIALALEHRSHRGPIIAVSTHGLLPHPHEEKLPPAWEPRVGGPAMTPRHLVRAMREEVSAAAKAGVGWRSVVDSIRPRTGQIWASWPERERRRFLRHARPYWEVHRHRMAPENAKTIAALRRSGQLRVEAGRIVGVREGRSSIEVRVMRRGSAALQTFDVSRVVNCTGPEMQYRLSRDPLVRDLLARGLARPGPLGLGFDAGERGALIGTDGRPSAVLFTLGPPLKGLFWETMAVPEIREQAAALAALLGPRFSSPEPLSPELS
jgi:uncharacterized NAD(P)/FAD-binding protein YdhS